MHAMHLFFHEIFFQIACVPKPSAGDNLDLPRLYMFRYLFTVYLYLRLLTSDTFAYL